MGWIRIVHLFVELLVVLVLVVAVASFPTGRAWLQSLITWRQQDEAPVATPGQVAPDAAAAFNRRANSALLARDDATAISDFLQGEAADPRFVWNFVALGGLYAQLNRLAAADEQFRQAINLAPDTQFLHYDLATVEFRERFYAAALRDFNIEVRISPEYKPAIEGRRQVLEALRAHPGRVAAAQPKATTLPSTPSSVPAPSPAPITAQAPTPTPLALRSALSSLTPRRFTPPSTVPVTVPKQEIRLHEGLPAPVAPPSVSTGAATEARTYLLDISQDLNFTQAVPLADPNATTTQLRQQLLALTRSPRGSEDGMLRVGAAALLSGRLSLAAAAFGAAADRAPGDWRGPYLGGLAARASGDNEGARTLFKEANSRAARPEVYTTLAIVELAAGDDDAAAADAEQAVLLDPSYGPGRFTAGMLALARKDAAAARRHLSAASNLSGVPARSGYFLSLVSQP